MSIKSIRGTKDIIGDDALIFQDIVSTANRLGGLYNFEYLSTPIFEATSLFARGLGDESDVVNKEMYSFTTKGEEQITLRPEFTASIARAVLENKLSQSLPKKFFSYGALFRYERPQKGRQRQFHQINFESYGVKDFFADAEVIFLAGKILKSLPINGDIQLHINSLGDSKTRLNYTNALIAYFTEFEDKLSEDSKRRLKKNPLRILDSKDKTDREIIENAPVIEDFYSDEAKEFFYNLLGLLRENDFPFEIIVNPQIVRGLDYYNHTVFEFIVEDSAMGSQNTILAGGRYDSLVQTINGGGEEIPAVGFAAGIERLSLLYKEEAIELLRRKNLVAIISDNNEVAFAAANHLRERDISCEIIYKGAFRKKIQKADKMNASDILFVFCDDENNEVRYELKNMQSGEQKEITFENLSAIASRYIA